MSAIRNIVVAGAGPVAWIAAIGLSRAFRHLALEVSVVDTGPTSDARVGRWTLPSQRGMHALLGINESHLLQQTGATFKLATEHIGWQGPNTHFMHAHGELGVDLGGLPFYKFLQAQRLAGHAESPESFSIAATAARLGKFARPMGEANAITASFTYGFHLEDAKYVEYLREIALSQKIHVAPSVLADVVLDDQGFVDALRLADGSLVRGDYYLDCSGPEARLVSKLGANERDDWSGWLPADRMWSALAPAADHPPALTQTFATARGWNWRAPLASSSMVGHVYSSRFDSDTAGREAFAAFAPSPLSEPLLTAFPAGRRRRFWVRNCVALGAAAVQLEPLAGADPHLAQIGLATFVELFPLNRESSVEADEYNRLMGESADALRDFTLAHYRAGAPRREEFWAATRAQELPARLKAKLDLYSSIGRLVLLDQEAFEETDWAWLLLGAGCDPSAMELQIRLKLSKLPLQELNGLRQHILQLVSSMPSHIDFLRHQAAAARGARS